MIQDVHQQQISINAKKICKIAKNAVRGGKGKKEKERKGEKSGAHRFILTVKLDAKFTFPDLGCISTSFSFL
jgi:hypothetical protein